MEGTIVEARLLGVLRSSGSERPTRLVQAVMRQTSSSRHDVREALRELVDRREVALNRQGELTSDTTKPSLWFLTSSPIVATEEARRTTTGGVSSSATETDCCTPPPCGDLPASPRWSVRPRAMSSTTG